MSETQFAYIEKRLDKIEAKLDQAREDIIGLKVKASIWGGAAAVIAAMAMKVLGV